MSADTIDREPPAPRRRGRRPKEGQTFETAVLVRMSERQRHQLTALGGCDWVRRQIDVCTSPDSDPAILPGFGGWARPETRWPVPLAEARVQAGFPSPAENYERRDIDLNRLLVENPASTYLLRVQGDSMIDAGIAEDDLLVVDRSRQPKRGDIVVMQVDNEFTVKRLEHDDKGRPYLHAENHSGRYPDIHPGDAEEWRCFGVVRFALKSL